MFFEIKKAVLQFTVTDTHLLATFKLLCSLVKLSFFCAVCLPFSVSVEFLTWTKSFNGLGDE